MERVWRRATKALITEVATTNMELVNARDAIEAEAEALQRPLEDARAFASCERAHRAACRQVRHDADGAILTVISGG